MRKLKYISIAGPFALLLWSCGSAFSDKTPETLPDSTNAITGVVLFDSILFNKSSSELLPENEVTDIYRTAMAEYIIAVNDQNHKLSDSLFIQMNVDFPSIQLPNMIQKVQIRQLTMEEASLKTKQEEPWVLLNVMGWLTGDQADFIIVTFHDGARPQHNCNIHFSKNAETNEFALDSLNFDFVYSK